MKSRAPVHSLTPVSSDSHYFSQVHHRLRPKGALPNACLRGLRSQEASAASFMVVPIARWLERVWRNAFTILSEGQSAASRLGTNLITTARSATRAPRLRWAARLNLVVRRQKRQVHLFDGPTLGFPDARLGNQVRDVTSLADALRGRLDATVELL